MEFFIVLFLLWTFISFLVVLRIRIRTPVITLLSLFGCCIFICIHSLLWVVYHILSSEPRMHIFVQLNGMLQVADVARALFSILCSQSYSKPGIASTQRSFAHLGSRSCASSSDKWEESVNATGGCFSMDSFSTHPLNRTNKLWYLEKGHSRPGVHPWTPYEFMQTHILVIAENGGDVRPVIYTKNGNGTHPTDRGLENLAGWLMKKCPAGAETKNLTLLYARVSFLVETGSAIGSLSKTKGGGKRKVSSSLWEVQ